MCNCVRLFETPWTVAHQAPLSLGFSRQEYWSRLPFPSPGGSDSCSVVSDSLQSCGLYSPWNSPGQDTGVSSLSLLQGIFPIQVLNPGLPYCRQILYQLSHRGSPRILEWCNLSLLQQIFMTQELNWGLLHCRLILYQLSYQGRYSYCSLNSKHLLVSPHLALMLLPSYNLLDYPTRSILSYRILQNLTFNICAHVFFWFLE